MWAIRTLTEGCPANQAAIKALELQSMAETPLSRPVHVRDA